MRILKNGNDINIKLNLIDNDKPESLDGQTRVDAETQTHRTGEYPYKDGKKDWEGTIDTSRLFIKTWQTL